MNSARRNQSSARTSLFSLGQPHNLNGTLPLSLGANRSRQYQRSLAERTPVGLPRDS
jgi:hypothetical protein